MTAQDINKEKKEELERKRQERAVETLEQNLEILKKRKRGSYNDNRVDEDHEYYD